MKKFISFDYLITPRIINFLYSLALLCVIVGVFIKTTNYSWSTTEAIGAVVGVLLLRIPFEMAMVVFKNNEYLRRIAEKMEKEQE